jgi:hypothetical protein
MKKLLLIPLSLAAACATTGSAGSHSSAPFQGTAALQKRREEISDAASKVTECMKGKPGEKPGKGGVFAASADSAGKISIAPIVWDGPDTWKQCIVDAGNKLQISALPGPAVGALWEFNPPGETPQRQPMPKDLETKMQSLQETVQNEVNVCGDSNLGPGFGADIDVQFFLFTEGKAYATTIINSTAKDGGFDSCVQKVIASEKFPNENVDRPFPATFHFHVGRLDKM